MKALFFTGVFGVALAAGFLGGVLLRLSPEQCAFAGCAAGGLLASAMLIGAFAARGEALLVQRVLLLLAAASGAASGSRSLASDPRVVLAAAVALPLSLACVEITCDPHHSLALQLRLLRIRAAIALFLIRVVVAVARVGGYTAIALARLKELVVG